MISRLGSKGRQEVRDYFDGLIVAKATRKKFVPSKITGRFPRAEVVDVMRQTKRVQEKLGYMRGAIRAVHPKSKGTDKTWGDIY